MSLFSRCAALLAIMFGAIVSVHGQSTPDLALSSAGGIASQSCGVYPERANDGTRIGTYTHTCFDPQVYWEVELPGSAVDIEHIRIYPRQEGVQQRIEHTKVQIFDVNDEMVSEKDIQGVWVDGDLEVNFAYTPGTVVGKRVRLQKFASPVPGVDGLDALNLHAVEVYGTQLTANPTASPTKAPTASPTASPTFSPAPPGSFEIHSTGNVTGTGATSGTSIRLTAPYNASNRVHETTVLSPDCITPFTGTAKEAFQVGNTPDVSLGDGYISYNSTIDVDISKVNTTVWWKALSGGAVGGELDLCLESAIYFTLPDSTNETMNFVNTNLTLTVKMDANFEVTSIDAERKDATKEDLTLNYSQYVTAYQCTTADLETETIGEYSQGDELKICVTSTNPSIVQVGSIKSLALSQADGPGAVAGGAEFAYITGGVAVDDEIAATDCDESISPHVCHADMQLLGRYFAVDEPGDLTASGSVELTFGTGRRLTVDVPIAGGIRGGDLSLENSARRMQDKLPEESNFPGVQVSLKSVDGSGTSDFNGATLLSGLVAAAGGAILMV